MARLLQNAAVHCTIAMTDLTLPVLVCALFVEWIMERSTFMIRFLTDECGGNINFRKTSFEMILLRKCDFTKMTLSNEIHFRGTFIELVLDNTDSKLCTESSETCQRNE